MAEHGEEEGVVPSGSFDFAFDGALVWMGAQDVEGELSDKSEILGSMVLSTSRGILVEGDVEHPVQLVFDCPMCTRDFDQPLGGQRPGEKEPAFERRFVLPCIASPRLREVGDPAPGSEPLLWRLLTTLPVEGQEAADEAVRLYRLRWRIEEVRSLQLVGARNGSSLPMSDVLDQECLEAVAVIGKTREGATHRQKNPHPQGSLAWLSWIVARYGGWNCYGKPPGPKTMAQGWRQFAAVLAAFLIAQQLP